jgi:single-strand DNA-binding protein
MSSLNHVVLIGRLVRDPELRQTASGTPVASFTLAVDRRPKADGGKEADFLKVVAWGKLGENCAGHLGKGRLVAVDGRLQVSTYQGKDDQKHSSVEVVAENVQFLSPKPSDQGGPASEPSTDAEMPGEDYDLSFSPEE